MTDGLDVLIHPDGWVADARVRDGRAVVAAGHPLAGEPGVTSTARELPEVFADLVVERCTSLVGVLADRSRRGRAGLWAQVADVVGGAAATVAGAEPSRAQEEVVAATRRLLDTPAAPWRTQPALRSVPGGDGRILVVHRGSCCLAYRCPAPEPAEPSAPGTLERAYLERFGDDPARYCDTCLFRAAGDVDTRAAWYAGQSAA